MVKKKTTKPGKIPEFTSLEEEAEFWDAHSTADYEDEFKPVRAHFSKNLSENLAVRLDPETLAQLREVSHAKGIGPTTLIRMWIIEHLKEETRPSP